MKNVTKSQIAWAVVVVAIVVAMFLGVNYPIPDPPAPVVELGTTNFDDLTVDDDLTVTDDAAITGLLTVGETLAVTGASTLTGNVTASGDLTVDDTISLDDTDSAIVGAQTLTPTTTFYQFAPATLLTLTLATASATDGDILILHNTVATATTVVDTGATVGGSVITLGTNDLAILIYGNSKWIEVASPDNS